MSIFEDDQNYLPSKLIKPGRKVKIPKPFFYGRSIDENGPIKYLGKTRIIRTFLVMDLNHRTEIFWTLNSFKLWTNYLIKPSKFRTSDLFDQKWAEYWTQVCNRTHQKFWTEFDQNTKNQSPKKYMRGRCSKINQTWVNWVKSCKGKKKL